MRYHLDQFQFANPTLLTCRNWWQTSWMRSQLTQRPLSWKCCNQSKRSSSIRLTHTTTACTSSRARSCRLRTSRLSSTLTTCFKSSRSLSPTYSTLWRSWASTKPKRSWKNAMQPCWKMKPSTRSPSSSFLSRSTVAMASLTVAFETHRGGVMVMVQYEF